MGSEHHHSAHAVGVPGDGLERVWTRLEDSSGKEVCNIPFLQRKTCMMVVKKNRPIRMSALCKRTCSRLHGNN